MLKKATFDAVFATPKLIANGKSQVSSLFWPFLDSVSSCSFQTMHLGDKIPVIMDN